MPTWSPTSGSLRFEDSVTGWRCIGIKSLYFRVVLIYIGVVIVSLFAAFAVAQVMYRSQVENMLQDTLLGNGKKIIYSYQSTPAAQMIPFMQNAADISNSTLQIFDSNMQPVLPDKKPQMRVALRNIRHVLAGGIVHDRESRDHHLTVGLPFQLKGKPYALFMMPTDNNLFSEIGKAMRTVLIIVLVFGSVLILVASRYIVQPLLRLTDATKRMAKGKFDVAIRTKRNDEIGQLTSSFNEMALELAKLDRMRQDFVTNVSHEIQTPLTSILGFTKALKQKVMSEEHRRHYLNIIEEESERLSRLGQHLLQLSNLQHGPHQVKLGTYRLDEQIRNIVIALQPQWSSKQIDIDLELSKVTVEADEDQLTQVWTNLLGNSIKFSPAHSSIVIRAVQREEFTVVSISDHGIGIPPEERTDIFKPFHKVDRSRDRNINGNGLGLSIVKQIVDLHQGHIKVTGEPGQGTTFTVTLPKRYDQQQSH